MDDWIGSIVGDVILLSRLGSGTMGTVYRGRSEKLDRLLAVKLIRDDHTAEELARFLREGRAAAKVHSDHVVRIYSTGEVNGHVFLVLELVDGETMATRMDRLGAMDPWAVAHIGFDVSLGLAAIHEAGIVHRDIKPDNLLIAGNGRVKIADLGLAKVSDDLKLTATRALVGTPLYVAPEGVLDPQSIAAPSDVYGLGATLYHAIAGVPPYNYPDASTVIRAKIEGPPARLRQLRSDVPAEICQMIERCLDREPSKRPTASELAGLLSESFMKQTRR